MKSFMRLLCLIILLLASTTHAAPVFSSTYSQMDKTCSQADEEDENSERLVCKPVGSYQMIIDSSAVAISLAIQDTRKKNEPPLEVATRITKLEAALEWRLADGKPFAVITRTQEWKENPKMNGSTEAPFIVTDEKLAIRGLGKCATLNTTIPARQTGANEKARQLADSAWSNPALCKP